MESKTSLSIAAAMDNFQVEQLRLENQWLRQRLHAAAKLKPLRGPKRTLVLEREHQNDCRCGLCETD